LMSGEGKGAYEIEFGHDAPHPAIFHDGKCIKVVLFEERFQSPQRRFAVDRTNRRGHVLGSRAPEEAVHVG